MKKVMMIALMLAGAAIAAQPMAAFAEESIDTEIEESQIDAQYGDEAVTDDAAEPAVEEDSYEEHTGH